VDRPTRNLDAIAEDIREVLSARDAAREKVLVVCRECIRHCSTAIRAAHRQELDEARNLLRSARSLLDEADRAAAEQVELTRAGYVRDAQKEYSEGRVLLAVIAGEELPTPEDLGVDPVSYLHGLGDAAGEVRRYLLDSMRKGDLSRGEEFLGVMDDIYSVLVTMDYPDAVTAGLRRATDMVRGVLERTRSDLTLTMRQGELEKRLSEQG